MIPRCTIKDELGNVKGGSRFWCLAHSTVTIMSVWHVTRVPGGWFLYMCSDLTCVFRRHDWSVCGLTLTRVHLACGTANQKLAPDHTHGRVEGVVKVDWTFSSSCFPVFEKSLWPFPVVSSEAKLSCLIETDTSS